MLCMWQKRKPEEFHLKCQRQILYIHWSQHISSAEVSARTGLPPVMDFIRRRRLSVFGHIARLTQGTPARLQHTTPYIAKLVWHPVIHLVGTGDVVLALAGQTNSATTLDLFLPTSGDRPFYGAMVERRDGPSWLHDDDDVVQQKLNIVLYVINNWQCIWCSCINIDRLNLFV